MDKYKKLASNTIIFAIGTFSSKILSFLLMPFVTRMMDTGDYGAADLIQQTGNVIIPIVFLAVNSAALRFSMDKAADKADVFTVGVRTTLGGFIAFLLFAYPISLIKINDFSLGSYIELIYVFVLTSGMRQLCQQFVRGSGHVKLFAVDGILATVTYLVFTMLFLGVFKWGVNGYILAIVASDFCSVVFFFVTAKLYKYVKLRGVSRLTSHGMLRYCIPLIPTIILWWIINVSDRYMITYFIGSSANGLYSAASKIPNLVIMCASIFTDAWQLSAVDEYNNKDTARFFSKIFRVYCGGTFAVASALILLCKIITTILVADSYYESWRYVPILIIATTFSCLVNFLASVYMAEKKSTMAMLTASSGAVTNVVLNFVLIPKYGANGAAVATAIAFLVVFATRSLNTRRYIKINYQPVILACQTIVLICQSVAALVFKGVWFYVAEAVLFVVMLLMNRSQISELWKLVTTKFLGRFKKS